jgi:valyl-tRNA synthetase
MPFITEEIYHHLSGQIRFKGVTAQGSIMDAAWPGFDKSLTDPQIDVPFSLVKDCVVALRTIKSENNVPPDKWGTAVIVTVDESTAQWLRSQVALINRFAKLTETVIGPDATKPGFAGSAVVGGNQLFISFEGLIDSKVELDRLGREEERLVKLIDSTQKRLGSSGFADKAPAEVIAKEKEKLEGLRLNLEKVGHTLAALRAAEKK